MKKRIFKKSIMFFSTCLLVVLFFPLSLSSKQVNPNTTEEAFNDCPYIFYDGEKVVVKWIEAGNLIERIYSNNDFEDLKIDSCEEFEAKYLNIHSTEVFDNKQNYKDVKKIAILSDIHGQHDLFIELLKVHQIIDAQGNWKFGEGHFVIVGDVFDRGDKVTETLWFLYKLEQQAAILGGKVHLLLGNHEIMVMKGDLRYVSEKYQWVSDKMELSYDELFDSNTLMGQWLRTKPVAISVNDIAFAHAGFSPEFASRQYNIESTNQLFHEEIIDHEKDQIMSNDTLRFMVKSDGPIWYRGYFNDENFSKKKAQKILNEMGMTAIVVGHTSMNQVLSHYDGLIFSVDSSIKKGEYGEMLFWESGQFFRGTLKGERIKLI